MRALLANMVTGVSKGFEKKLEIYGTGYKVCATPIERIAVRNRGTYFCPKCQSKATESTQVRFSNL
jgi:formamidopyrimidine-DNA glycosylase